MNSALSSLGYLCFGTLFGLAVMALVFAVARRRGATDEALHKGYGPLHTLLTEDVAARAKVDEIEKKLMESYASESSPHSPEDKKAAAEGFLAAEVAMFDRVINPNRERMREIVAAWGHLLRDDDYLALSAELSRARTERVLSEMSLPKALRDERLASDREAEVLAQVRETYLELSHEQRAGFFPSLFRGLKAMFSAD